MKMKKYQILALQILFTTIFSFECNSLKLDNISTNRALSTLRALGYNIIEHTNVYIDDIKTDNLLPMDEVNIDENIFIIPRDSGFGDSEMLSTAIEDLRSKEVKVIIGPISNDDFQKVKKYNDIIDCGFFKKLVIGYNPKLFTSNQIKMFF